MYDNTLFFASLAEKKKSYLFEKLQIERDSFGLATIHRDLNTDDVLRLNSILSTILVLAEEYKMVFIMPLHPRTNISLKNNLGELHDRLKAADT